MANGKWLKNGLGEERGRRIEDEDRLQITGKGVGRWS